MRDKCPCWLDLLGDVLVLIVWLASHSIEMASSDSVMKTMTWCGVCGVVWCGVVFSQLLVGVQSTLIVIDLQCPPTSLGVNPVSSYMRTWPFSL